MGELGRAGWAAALLCASLAACNVNGGEGTHGDGGGTTGNTGSGGTTGATDGPPIVLDAGAVRPGTVRMVVPAYWEPDAQWDKIIADAPTVGMIIFNPQSGPGTATDPAYTTALAKAQAAGIIVLGYVSTQYGARAQADIEADVNGYYSLYTPSGIYFAEGPTETGCDSLQAEYSQLTALARSHDSKAYVAIGTRFCPTYITFSDLIVEFAETWSSYQSFVTPSWMPGNSASRFIHFVSEVPPDQASHALSMAIGFGAGWVFATDGTLPNPWGALPSYYDQELAALKKLQ
jgi:hypothetical protein